MVTITWSATNGGSSITSYDHGEGTSGETLTYKTLFIRHDGTNSISQCKFYLVASGGSGTAHLAEIIGWGDGSTADAFGGFQLNMDATGGFPATWSTYSSKSGTNYNVCRTGVGDSSSNGILLPQAMGLTGSPGVLQAGSSPNVSFRCRIQIPTDEGNVGARQFSQALKFSYTS